MGHVTLTSPIWGWFIIPRLILDMAYLCIKSEKTSISHSRDMTKTQNVQFWVTQGHRQWHYSTQCIQVPVSLSLLLSASLTPFLKHIMILVKNHWFLSTTPVISAHNGSDLIGISPRSLVTLKNKISWAITRHCLLDYIFRCFDRASTCDEWTDRQTETEPCIYRASTAWASCGKNQQNDTVHIAISR